MRERRFWPINGGTWKERFLAAAYFLLLISGWASIYLVAWLIEGR